MTPISELKNWSVNDYADFWRDEAGLNIIPADTRKKSPKVEWKQFQHKAIPVELHNFWKKGDMFKDGMMIIAGQVWHNERKKGLFLNCIDLDNELAIQEFCKINGQQMSLNVVADTGHFTVEQHEDDPTRAHIFVWSDKRPFKKKISNSGDNVPRIEVKGEGNDSLVSVTPSPHTNGSNYEFVGDWHLAVMEPKIHNQIEEHINTICENYGIEYLNGNANANRNYNPVLRNKQKIPKGERHSSLVRYANSLIARLHKTTNRETIQRYFETYNNQECEEPLPESELKQIFNDSWDNITTKSTNTSQEQKQQESEIEIINDNDNEPISYEEWTIKLLEKRKHLEDTIKKNIPQLWLSIQLIASVKCILNMKDCTLPLIMILLGAASSLKTVPIEMFRKWVNTFYTDNFSAKAMVSHSTAVKKDELPDIDMLPKIKYKLFLAPELSPIFTKKDDELVEILGIMTRIADGRGYESDTGAHGHRGYVGEYMFTMVGAAIDIPYKVHKYLGFLGPKLYFFRLPKLEKSDNDYFNQLKDCPFNVKFQNIQVALKDYLKWLELCPKMEINSESKLGKIVWDSDKDDNEAIRIIIRLGRLLSHLRAVVPTWETHGSQGTDYAYATAMKEEPDRAMEQLRNISRGFALSKGRNYITKEDLSLPIKVVLSTASVDRVNIFDLLLAHKGKLVTKVITTSLNTSHHTAHRIMTELKAIGLVDIKEPETETEEKEITLKDEFDYFLGEEFKQLREGFISTDNTEEFKEYSGKGSLEEKSPPINSPIYNCYECVRVNHGTPIFQTDSQKEYETHWIKSGHKGTCYPNNADLQLHGWTAQGKEWET